MIDVIGSESTQTTPTIKAMWNQHINLKITNKISSPDIIQPWKEFEWNDNYGAAILLFSVRSEMSDIQIKCDGKDAVNDKCHKKNDENDVHFSRNVRSRLRWSDVCDRTINAIRAYLSWLHVGRPWNSVFLMLFHQVRMHNDEVFIQFIP